GYVHQNGTMHESYYKRYNGRIDTEFALGNHIKIGENLSLLYRQKSNGDNAIGTSYMMLPIVPLRDIMGNYAGSFGGPSLGSFSNSVANQDRDKGDLNYNWGIAGNVYLDASIIKDLVFRTSLGLNYNTNYERDFTGTQTENVEASGSDNKLSINSGYSNTLTFTNTLTYNKSLNQHNFQVLLGTESISYIDRDLTGSSSAFFYEDENYLNINNGTLNILSSS